MNSAIFAMHSDEVCFLVTLVKKVMEEHWDKKSESEYEEEHFEESWESLEVYERERDERDQWRRAGFPLYSQPQFWFDIQEILDEITHLEACIDRTTRERATAEVYLDMVESMSEMNLLGREAVEEKLRDMAYARRSDAEKEQSRKKRRCEQMQKILYRHFYTKPLSCLRIIHAALVQRIIRRSYFTVPLRI